MAYDTLKRLFAEKALSNFKQKTPLGQEELTAAKNKNLLFPAELEALIQSNQAGKLNLDMLLEKNQKIRQEKMANDEIMQLFHGASESIPSDLTEAEKFIVKEVPEGAGKIINTRRKMTAGLTDFVITSDNAGIKSMGKVLFPELQLYSGKVDYQAKAELENLKQANKVALENLRSNNTQNEIAARGNQQLAVADRKALHNINKSLVDGNIKTALEQFKIDLKIYADAQEKRELTSKEITELSKNYSKMIDDFTKGMSGSSWLGTEGAAKEFKDKAQAYADAGDFRGLLDFMKGSFDLSKPEAPSFIQGRTGDEGKIQEFQRIQGVNSELLNQFDIGKIPGISIDLKNGTMVFQGKPLLVNGKLVAAKDYAELVKKDQDAVLLKKLGLIK